MKKVFLLSLIAFYVHAQTLYFNNYDSLGKNDKVVTNATFEGLATTTMVSEAVAPLVPTNRTITVGSQVGSLETNLVFASTGTGVTESTVTNIAQAVVDANVPTLAEAANVGGFSGTETITPLNIVMGGYFQALLGDGASTIDSSAKGASQSGLNYGSLSIGANSHGASQSGLNYGSLSIGANSHGASQSGDNFGGSQSIGDSSHGASQSGYNEYLQSIGDSSHGASQSGLNYGSLSIGANSHGAMQRGQLLSADSSAINNAAGAVQIFSLTNGQHALTTTDGAASLLIGAGIISNKNTIVVGDGEYSHGQGSITAGGGFFGSALVIAGTNIQDYLNQRVEKSNGTATNLSVFSSLNLLGHIITWNFDRQTFDVPLFGGVTGQLFQEQLLLVRNQTGANIANGKIVCSAGAVGDNAAIRKASSSDASCAWGVLGMVTQDAGIDHGSDGLICTSGEVNNLPLPTSIYQPSNTLWLTTDGNYTNVEPQNVAVKYQIGIVLRAHASQGRILLNPQYIAPDRITSQSIIRDIVTSTNVVRVTSTQSVYVATVASPCVITQDVSALSLATNQTAFWTTRINVTDWSATNGVTFATNIAAYAGDFTVTGCYDFACSLLCDGRIEMRQTFPTVYPWAKSPTSAPGVNTTYDICTFERKTILGASDLSKTIVAEIPCVTCPYIVRTLFYAGSPSAWATNVSISAGLVWFGNLEYGSALYTTNSISTNAIAFKITQHYVPSISLQPTTSARLYFNVSRPGLAGGFTLHGVEYRQANENEIKAFNAGWRPR